jgi:hypothetical protein
VSIREWVLWRNWCFCAVWACGVFRLPLVVILGFSGLSLLFFKDTFSFVSFLLSRC